MSAPSRHIAGKLVARLLADPRAGRRDGPVNYLKSGPWRVESKQDEVPGRYFLQSLWHYSTEMLRWSYDFTSGQVTIIGTWTGHGSVSDQTGVNSALWALGSSLRYSRDQRGGGPRINPRRRRRR
jgi:hypothetical protein